MLNYVDHETPRHYFLCANADEECLEKFAELVRADEQEACAKLVEPLDESLADEIRARGKI